MLVLKGSDEITNCGYDLTASDASVIITEVAANREYRLSHSPDTVKKPLIDKAVTIKATTDGGVEFDVGVIQLIAE